MKQILLAILLVIASFAIYAQPTTTFYPMKINASIGVFTPSGGPGDFTGAVGTIGSTGYIVDSLLAGDVLVDDLGHQFQIDSVVIVVSGSVATLFVTDAGNYGSAPVSGRGTLVRYTQHMHLIPLTQAGSNFITEEAFTKIVNNNFSRIDSLYSKMNTAVSTSYNKKPYITSQSAASGIVRMVGSLGGFGTGYTADSISYNGVRIDDGTEFPFSASPANCAEALKFYGIVTRALNNGGLTYNITPIDSATWADEDEGYFLCSTPFLQTVVSLDIAGVSLGDSLILHTNVTNYKITGQQYYQDSIYIRYPGGGITSVGGSGGQYTLVNDSTILLVGLRTSLKWNNGNVASMTLNTGTYQLYSNANVLTFRNVVYVDDVLGDDASGTVDDPNHPYKNLSAGALEAPLGSIIYCVRNTTYLSAVNLTAKCLDYYGEKGTIATLVCNPISSPLNRPTLYRTGGKHFIKSGGSVIISGGFSLGRNITYDIDVDSLASTGNFLTLGHGYINLKTKKASIATLLRFAVSVDSLGRTFDINIGKLYLSSTILEHNTSGTSANISGHLKIDELEASANTLIGTGSRTIQNTDMTFDIGYFYPNASVTASNANGLWYFSTESRDMSGFRLNININRGVFYTPLFNNFYRFGNSSTAGNTYVKFNCKDCTYLGAGNSLMTFDAFQGNSGGTAITYFDGNYTSLNSSILSSTGSSRDCKFVFSGTYKTLTSGEPAFDITDYTDNNLVFSNAKIVTNAAEAVRSANPVQVTCMNVFTSSTTVDADVTETIQGMVRSSLVK